MTTYRIRAADPEGDVLRDAAAAQLAEDLETLRAREKAAVKFYDAEHLTYTSRGQGLTLNRRGSRWFLELPGGEELFSFPGGDFAGDYDTAVERATRMFKGWLEYLR
jgi:hypothetical protein